MLGKGAHQADWAKAEQPLPLLRGGFAYVGAHTLIEPAHSLSERLANGSGAGTAGHIVQFGLAVHAVRDALQTLRPACSPAKPMPRPVPG